MTVKHERLSQRDLALHLRAAIDSVMATEGLDHPLLERRAQRGLEEIQTLVREHPRGIQSTYVRYHLGRIRLVWLTNRGLIHTSDMIKR